MKLIKAWLISFVVIFLLSMLWYGVIVSGYNAVQFEVVMRGQEDFSMSLIVIGYLILTFLLAYVYPKGYQKEGGSPVSQGLRYGILLGLLWALPTAFIESGSYQFPLGARLLDTLYHIIEFGVAGVIIGWAYGDSVTAPETAGTADTMTPSETYEAPEAPAEDF